MSVCFTGKNHLLLVWYVSLAIPFRTKLFVQILNPNIQTLNPKQFQNSNDVMFKTRGYYLPKLF